MGKLGEDDQFTPEGSIGNSREDGEFEQTEEFGGIEFESFGEGFESDDNFSGDIGNDDIF